MRTSAGTTLGVVWARLHGDVPDEPVVAARRARDVPPVSAPSAPALSAGNTASAGGGSERGPATPPQIVATSEQPAEASGRAALPPPGQVQASVPTQEESVVKLAVTPLAVNDPEPARKPMQLPEDPVITVKDLPAVPAAPPLPVFTGRELAQIKAEAVASQRRAAMPPPSPPRIVVAEQATKAPSAAPSTPPAATVPAAPAVPAAPPPSDVGKSGAVDTIVDKAKALGEKVKETVQGVVRDIQPKAEPPQPVAPATPAMPPEKLPETTPAAPPTKPGRSSLERASRTQAARAAGPNVIYLSDARDRARAGLETRHRSNLGMNSSVPDNRPRRRGAWYTVAAGETLSEIAARYYGSDRKGGTMRIYRANRSRIDKSKALREGLRIYIPAD